MQIDRPLSLMTGPQPGLLGDIAALHGRYYAEHWGFPVAFECKVAREFAEFLVRYDPALDLVLSAQSDGRFTAAIALDGSDPALGSGQSHLRWFFVSPQMQGRGFGRRMLGDAVEFARRAGRRSVYLTTFRGLDAAAALYKDAGFAIVDEREGRTWGRTVTEQRHELTL